jgi:hypothetical protein
MQRLPEQFSGFLAILNAEYTGRVLTSYHFSVTFSDISRTSLRGTEELFSMIFPCWASPIDRVTQCLIVREGNPNSQICVVSKIFELTSSNTMVVICAPRAERLYRHSLVMKLCQGESDTLLRHGVRASDPYLSKRLLPLDSLTLDTPYSSNEDETFSFLIICLITSFRYTKRAGMPSNSVPGG